MVISSLNRENSSGIVASFAKPSNKTNDKKVVENAESAFAVDKKTADGSKGGVDWSRRFVLI